MNDVPETWSKMHEQAEPKAARAEALNLPDFIERYAAKIAQVRAEVGRVFIGPDARVEELLVALFARGHILLEGVPGVAKTTLARAFAETLDAQFSRIQFTPDLLPSDITGTSIPNLNTNEFNLRRGPVFANIVLGDEINRAPAKTQSALLEAMQERQVTIDGTTHRLAEPFLVIATQNPIEQEGVYALPEAQLDRFLLKMTITYPTPEQEFRVIKTHQIPLKPVAQVLKSADIVAIQHAVEAVHISDELIRYIVALASYTREHEHSALGASPRAALGLLRAAKARALIRERDFVLPDDVRALAPAVLTHRVLLVPQAQLAGLSAEKVVAEALGRVSYARDTRGA